MANIIGTIPQGTRRNLLGALAARVNETVRLNAERAEGEGLRRLLSLLEQLPDSVTAILQPTLGFMKVDCCVIGAGKVLVINTLHFRGKIGSGERDEWVGAPGAVDLGRPDRRAHVFCDRLVFSGNAKGFDVEPAVICTEAPVEYGAPESMAPLVAWPDAKSYLERCFPAGVQGFDPKALVQLLAP